MRQILILFLINVGVVNAQRISVQGDELRYRTPTGIRTAVDSDTLRFKLFEKVDKVAGKVLSTNDYTNTAAAALSAAAVNIGLLQADRNSLFDSVSNKVDKVAGKGLSANDYTNTEKTKLAAIGGSTFSATKVLINTNVDAGYSLDVNGSARIVGQLISDGGISTNTRIGEGSLGNNTTGEQNSALGQGSFFLNTTGSRNTAVGQAALYSNTSGNHNTAVGQTALFSNNVGGENTGIGRNAGRFSSVGGAGVSASERSVFIGADTKALANSQTNQIVLGWGATGNGSNSVQIGNANITNVATNGDFETLDAGDGLILKTPDGTKRYKITINNLGQILSTQL